jgi:hypothetical protein
LRKIVYPLYLRDKFFFDVVIIMKSKFAMQHALLISSLISLGISSTIISDVVFADTTKPAVATTPAQTPAAAAPAPTAAAPATPAASSKTPASTAPAAASSLPAIAQAIWIKGTVTAAQPGGEPRTLTRRSVVYEHDVVSTDKTSSGEIGFTDGSLMSLNPDSAIKIDQYQYTKGGGKDDKAVMNLVKGGFRTITGAIPKENPDGYKMNTPVATIGVRGTEYVTVLSPEKGLLLKIEKGQIKVINAAGTIDLTECSTGGAESCDSYGVVKSFDIRPETTSTMPAEMANVAPVTSLPPGFGLPGKPTSPQGPSKSVGSFCVGLLDSVLEEIHKFFA